MEKKKLKIGDLVAVEEYGVYYSGNGTRWVKNKNPSHWFGTIGDIREPGDVPHEGPSDLCIRVDFFSSDSGETMWSWEGKKSLYFIKRNFKDSMKMAL